MPVSSSFRRRAPLLAGAALLLLPASHAWAQSSDGASSGSTSTGSTSTGSTSTTPATTPGYSLGPPTASLSNSSESAGIGFGSKILPATGFGGDLGNIRDFVNTPLTRGNTRSYQFDGSIGADIGYTDNANGQYSTGSGANRQKAQGSIEAHLRPTISLTAESRRTQINLVYDPVITYYPSANRQSRIDQYLNAGSVTEFVPGTAYLELRAFATQTSNSNINGPTGSSVLSRQDRQQVYDFSAHPYLVHSFGDVGTARIGYTIDATQIQNGGNNTATSSSSTNPYSVFGTTGNSRTLTQGEEASFTTGDNFGRWKHTFALSGSQTSGTGSLRNSRRNLATYDVAYAYSRFITFTGRVGYEDLFYSGTRTNGVQVSNPYKLSEPIYSVGAIVTPNADSSIEFSYGHIDGGESLFLRATYKPTARFVVYASSSSSLTTNAQQVQAYVSGSQVAANGVTVDPSTGAPVQYASTGTNNAAQVYRLTQTSLTGALLYARDTITASLIRSERSSPNGATNTTASSGIAGTSSSASLGWSHTVSDTVSTNATAQYGIDETKGGAGVAGGSTSTYSGSAQVTKVFTEKLSGNASYTYYRRGGYQGQQGVTVNEFLVGLLQRF